VTGDEGMQITDQTASSKSLVPPYNWRAHWLTVNEFSRMMGRAPDTVHWWIRQGVLADFGIPVMQFRQGKRHSGRTFILNIY
jgi:hypothetical protein